MAKVTTRCQGRVALAEDANVDNEKFAIFNNISKTKNFRGNKYVK